ncbi:MAG: hypothetical protein AB2777_21390, partial [Candidatus Thiodiazotropha endolucinida]
MTRRSDHSHEKIRVMALEAAEQIILEQGHAELTACKVASETVYTAGALYLDFENLNNLILHINARTLDRLLQVMTVVQLRHLTDEDRSRFSSANCISTLLSLIQTAGRSYLNIVLLM